MNGTTLIISRSTQAGSNVPNFQATPEQLVQLEALLTSAARGGQAAAEQPPGSSSYRNAFPLCLPYFFGVELSLADILTPANLVPLFTNHPELIPSLFPHLPPDLPVPPSADVLNRIIK